MKSGGLVWFDNSGPQPDVIALERLNIEDLGKLARNLLDVAGPGEEVSDAERLRLQDAYLGDAGRNDSRSRISDFLKQADAAQLTKVLQLFSRVNRHLVPEAAHQWQHVSGLLNTGSCIPKYPECANWFSGAATVFNLYVRSDNLDMFGIGEGDVILGFKEETADHNISFGIAWSDLNKLPPPFESTLPAVKGGPLFPESCAHKNGNP